MAYTAPTYMHNANAASAAGLPVENDTGDGQKVLLMHPCICTTDQHSTHMACHITSLASMVVFHNPTEDSTATNM
jgi:hypothetical protein